MATAFKPHRFSVAEYDRLVETGFYGPDDRIELIDGQLIDVPPQDPVHAGTLWYCAERFREAFGTRIMLRAQAPLRLGDHSEPEPDIALVRRDERFYRDRHPAAEDTTAVVEVANTSLAFDRDVKRLMYAAARISEYWIIDIQGQVVEMHREPHDLGYAWHESRKRGQSVSFEAFADVVFSVDELLG